MSEPASRRSPEGVATALAQLGEGVSGLLKHHVELAKVELREDARELGGALVVLIACLPFVLVGYGFLCFALASFLGRFLAPDAGLLVVGVANALGGGLGLWRASMRLKRRHPMSRSGDELKSSLALFGRGRAAHGAGDGG